MNDFGVPQDYRDELKRIVVCAKSLRKVKPGKKTEWNEAAECHVKYSNLHGESVLALTITLSPTGCEWARKGGCTMCGEFEGSYKRRSLTRSPQFHISQFAAAIGDPRVWALAKKENKSITWLRINQEGNYTNIHEMNFQAQEVILRLAMHIEGIKRITIESRPQYITEESVAFLKKLFDGSSVELEIGMGVEAENDVVRDICINKHGSRKQFNSAVELLKANNILPLAYVLLKPPFLTEAEAIDEAVATAHFAVNTGFSRISFEPMSIHHYTLVDALVKTGDYKAPWLWSVVEVAKRCSDISSMFGIGGVGYYPIPAEYSSNACSNEVDCTENFSAAIVEYNKKRNVSVFDSLTCDCKSDWEKACRHEASPLKERIQQQLTRVETLLPTYSVIENNDFDNIMRNQRILMSFSQ
jgi:radical SAM enzyme (TIGR01210 family)